MANRSVNRKLPPVAQWIRDGGDKIILERVKEFLKRQESTKKNGMPDSRDLNDKTWRDRPPLI